MADAKRFANPYLWLGQPATAQGVIPASAGYQLPTQNTVLQAAFLQNRSASAAACALIGLLPDSAWEAGQWDDATTTYTTDTTDAQDVGANDFELEVIGAPGASDGFLIGCDTTFGAIGLDIGTAGVGAGSVHVIEYWNGTAWTAISATGMLKDIPRTAGQNWAANEALVLFDPPVDWVVGGTGTNVNQTRFNLRVRATTVPTTAALAKRIYVGKVIVSIDGLAANGEFSRYYNPPGVNVDARIVSLGAAFSVADGSNTLEIVL